MLTDTGWFHDLSPYVWRISGDFGIRWYGVSYLLAFVIAYFLLRWLARRGVTPIPRDRIADVMMLLVGGVIVGGRLGYIVLYDPALLIDFSGSAPWWGVLRLTNGGMSSHGGFLGVMAACWWIGKGFKDEHGNRIGACPAMHVMDMCAMVAPLGLMLGRLANFVNGELLGKVIAKPGQPAPWWSVRYPQEILERPLNTLSQTPEQLGQIIGLSTQYMLPSETAWEQGYLRVLEMIRNGNMELQAQLEPLISARYPTQFMQAFFDGLLVFIVVWAIAYKPRRVGVLGAWMWIVYALGRIPMDMVRLPDAGVSQFGPLTRGQGYSLLMLIAGIVALVVIHRVKRPYMGGWGSGTPLASEAGDAEGRAESKDDDSQ
ncbi:MAG: prolipoprotein diacylglyceryl transferase [Phycisphaerales bacterium]|nr:prolipoprotein diacylglyceryl transferase [Phycisphaerales bacterium]